MRYKSYLIRPQQHGIDISNPSINAPFPFGYWGSLNFRIDQHSIQKPWGYHTADRSNLGNIQHIILYQVVGGTRYTCYLNDADLITKETVSGKTWSYTTQTTVYTTLVESIVNNLITLSSTVSPDADGVDDGDYFILDDDYTSDEETHRVVPFDTGASGGGNTPDPDDTVTAANGATGKIKIIDITSNNFATGDAVGDLILTTCNGTWVDGDVLTFEDGETAAVNGTSLSTWSTIASASDGNHTITLDETYPGTKDTGWSGGSRKTCYIRHVYTTPTDERWSWCVVNDKLVFTNGDDVNGNTNVQYWDGAAVYATDLSGSAIKARYCMEYANRLIIADHGTTRDPVGVAWSVNGDPTDWTGIGSGSVTFMETKDFITGLGKVGANIIIYFKDAIRIGHRTAVANPAIIFPIYKRGIGCVAPYGIIEAMGTNFFISRNDFYLMDGDTPLPIGEKIKDKFFDIVGGTEIKRVFGFENNITHEAIWIANTDEGKLAFVYDYRRREWSVYEYGHDIMAAGTGVI